MLNRVLNYWYKIEYFTPCYPIQSALYVVSVRQTEVLPAGTLFSPHIRLPSDSASRRTPLSSANSSYCQACSGLSPPSDYACRAHYKKRKSGTGSAFFLSFLLAV